MQDIYWGEPVSVYVDIQNPQSLYISMHLGLLAFFP